MSRWQTPQAIREDLEWFKDWTICLFKGHNYDTDEDGYMCQQCFWGVKTNTLQESYLEAYNARPHKRFWGHSI